MSENLVVAENVVADGKEVVATFGMKIDRATIYGIKSE